MGNCPVCWMRWNGDEHREVYGGNRTAGAPSWSAFAAGRLLVALPRAAAATSFDTIGRRDHQPNWQSRSDWSGDPFRAALQSGCRRLRINCDYNG